jgi:hypothetical protein
MKEITKEQLEQAQSVYPPAPWVAFAYSRFSKTATKKGLRNIIVAFLMGLFFVGFAGTVLEWNRLAMTVVILTYAFGLLILVLYLFAAIQTNNSRIRKIAKLLNITVKEYNELVDKF